MEYDYETLFSLTNYFKHKMAMSPSYFTSWKNTTHTIEENHSAWLIPNQKMFIMPYGVFFKSYQFYPYTYYTYTKKSRLQPYKFPINIGSINLTNIFLW